jgi:hypothetical protein
MVPLRILATLPQGWADEQTSALGEQLGTEVLLDRSASSRRVIVSLESDTLTDEMRRKIVEAGITFWTPLDTLNGDGNGDAQNNHKNGKQAPDSSGLK